MSRIIAALLATVSIFALAQAPAADAKVAPAHTSARAGGDLWCC